jgi:hypothetical protein
MEQQTGLGILKKSGLNVAFSAIYTYSKPFKFKDQSTSPPPTTTQPNNPKFMLKNMKKASYNGVGLCLDDGGGQQWSKFHAWNCDPTNPSQQFQRIPNTKLIRNPNKNNLCLDDGGGTTNGATDFWLYPCDSNNINQQFDYDPNTKLLRNPNKNNLCLDDGGGTPGSNINFHPWTCDPNNINQTYTQIDF